MPTFVYLAYNLELLGWDASTKRTVWETTEAAFIGPISLVTQPATQTTGENNAIYKDRVTKDEFHWAASFIRSSWVAVGRWQSFDVPSSLSPALRPRHGPVRYSPLTLGLVLYIYRAWLSRWVSLGLPIRLLTHTICCPHRWLSPHPDAPNPGVMAYHILKRTRAYPLYLLENNLIACT